MKPPVDYRLVRNALSFNWAVLRTYRNRRGPWAVQIRSASWRGLRDVYATETGARLGLGERLAVAGMLWPAGDDE